jgi:LytS/YehU family sensor histidine kinase
MISLMIMAINIGNHLILNWKNEAVKSAELNQLVIEAELQSLKLQIDPHFVFNNLSVLSELILESQQLGYEYAENFSRIYRYMLVNSKKDTILLEDELKFLHSYMFLIKHRIGEGVSFSIEVDQESKNLSLPPLTLQLLVENALKHNRTSKKEPLKIKLYTNDKNELIVENTILPIEKPLDSSGIGIKNIIRRYKLLSEKEPEIVRTSHLFIVIIPLLKL